MYVLEASSSDNHWIAGVFLREHYATLQYDKVPNRFKPKYHIKEIPIKSYPFFLVDTFGPVGSRYKFYPDEETVRKEAGCSDVIYKVDRDFRPENPRKDSMGKLGTIYINFEE
jgi:hypothetical protein